MLPRDYALALVFFVTVCRPMNPAAFGAIFLALDEHGRFSADLRTLTPQQLREATPSADVTIQVSHSTLNYKDALALTHRASVVRRWPMVPGIDAVGRVVQSTHPRWTVGDAVMVNGWGLGESHWGGLAQFMRASGDWLMALPAAFSASQAMAIGTAGYTAALCVLALEQFGDLCAHDEVLVTGATGGVGSIAIALLSARGFRVTAATGKPEASGYLQDLGATQIIDRNTLAAPGKPLQKEQWAAAIDTLGGHTLANVCAQMRRGGAVAACGLAQALDFPATVAPFILRGVSLLGIDSAMAPMAKRQAAWGMLAQSLNLRLLDAMTQVVGLAQCFEVARQLMAGQRRGRVVVDMRL